MSVKDNLRVVLEQIRSVAQECGRDPESISLVAISKTKPREAVEEASEAGHKVFGENKVQEAADKHNPPIPGVELHMVGHLQRNKSKIAAGVFDRIHSLDSIKTVRQLDKHLGELGRTMTGLIQVNLGNESQKSGLMETEVEDFLIEAGKFTNLTIDGLMVLPPFASNPEDSRPYFRQLQELAAKLNDNPAITQDMVHLSMGMTGDYRQAIEEGATMIRVGTAIFGARY